MLKTHKAWGHFLGIFFIFGKPLWEKFLEMNKTAPLSSAIYLTQLTTTRTRHQTLNAQSGQQLLLERSAVSLFLPLRKRYLQQCAISEDKRIPAARRPQPGLFALGIQLRHVMPGSTTAPGQSSFSHRIFMRCRYTAQQPALLLQYDFDVAISQHNGP